MFSIEIQKQEEAETGWFFVVWIKGENSVSEYKVTLDREYYQKIANEEIEPEELIRRSFNFLLEREPKEAILSSFNLRVIKNYFPEYELEVTR